MCEMPHTHCTRRDTNGSKPHTRNGIKVMNPLDVKILLAKRAKDRAREMAKA